MCEIIFYTRRKEKAIVLTLRGMCGFKYILLQNNSMENSMLKYIQVAA